jgi:hypothetical protein
MNFEEWFLSEFGRYGFDLTHTLYDVNTFIPCKQVIAPNGRLIPVKITPELSDDLQAWGMTYDYHVEGLRELIRMEINRLCPEYLPQKERLKPVKTLDRFKFYEEHLHRNIQ